MSVYIKCIICKIFYVHYNTLFTEYYAIYCMKTGLIMPLDLDEKILFFYILKNHCHVKKYF